MSDTLVQELIRVFGLEGSSPETQAELIAGLGDVVLERVGREILNKLPEEAKGKFVELIGADDLPAMYTFVAQHIPDSDAFITSVITQEVQEIRAAYASALAGPALEAPQQVS